MSTACSAGVWRCGPKDEGLRFVMAALADSADDFGYCFPSQDTIADKVCCNKRSVMRRLQQLEAEGWLVIFRNVVNGRGNLYQIVLEKIGVTVSPMAKRSPMITRLLQSIGDAVSPMQKAKSSPKASPNPTQSNRISTVSGAEMASSGDLGPGTTPNGGEGVENLCASLFLPSGIGDTSAFSGDNPQASLVTDSAALVTDSSSLVTKTTEIGDKACHPNRKEPSGTEPLGTEPSGTEPSSGSNLTPLPPAAQGVADPKTEARRVENFRRFQLLKTELKIDLLGQPRHPNFRPVVPGAEDFDACFRDWWLDEVRYDGDNLRLMTVARDPMLVVLGQEKYRSRLDRLLRSFFSPNGRYTVTFNVQPAHHEDMNPAA